MKKRMNNKRNVARFKSVRILFLTGLISLMALGTSSCEKSEESDCESGVKGTIVDLTGLDGCGYVIELEDGERIEPTDWGKFEVPIEDGQLIWVEYHAVEAASICMVGEVVALDCMTER